MGQRIEAGAGRQVRVHGQRGSWVYQRYVRDYALADNRNFVALPGVVNDGELRNISGSSSGGWNANQGRAWRRNAVNAFKIQNVTAIGRDDANALGAVNHAAAADGDNDITALVKVDLAARHHLVILGIRRDLAEHHTLQPRLFKIDQQFF